MAEASRTATSGSCPACGRGLQEITSGRLRANACAGCKGLWFREADLRDGLGDRFDPERLVAAAQTRAGSRACPGCGSAMAVLLFPGADAPVEVDRCAPCRGLFLDAGELARIKAGLTAMPAGASPLRPARIEADADGETLSHYLGMDQEKGHQEASISWSTYFFILFSQLPVEVHTPRRRFPWTLFGIVCLCFYGFYATLEAFPHHEEFVRTWGAIPDLTLYPTGWYRLVTNLFLHAGLGHLLGNLYFLWIFGDNVQDVFMDHGMLRGPLRFLRFYLVTGVIAALAHCIPAFGDPLTGGIPLVGASGAISAVLAAYWRLFPGSRLYQIIFFKSFKIPVWFYFFLWILGNVALAVQFGIHSNVSWQAHLAGFTAGYFLLPRFLPYPLERYRRPPAAVATPA